MPMPFTNPFEFFNSPEFLRSMFIWLPSLIVWSLFWKGYALWRSARNYQKGWFVSLLIFNTLGILEILYLSLFQKNRQSK